MQEAQVPVNGATDAMQKLWLTGNAALVILQGEPTALSLTLGLDQDCVKLSGVNKSARCKDAS
jgi:hypothetical protein